MSRFRAWMAKGSSLTPRVQLDLLGLRQIRPLMPGRGLFWKIIFKDSSKRPYYAKAMQLGTSMQIRQVRQQGAGGFYLHTMLGY